MKADIKENLKPIIFIVIVLVLTAISAYPQRIGGKVVEVIDGKTFVVEIPNGRVTAVLQYIEIPEADQPLYDTVKAHLQKLILDKTVEFQPGGVKWDKTFGKLFVKGVDVSQQMLRDGAAWYSVPEKNGQNEAESLRYQDNETQARTEKRGIWSVAGLKPAWEYRAEKEALQRQQQQEALAKLKLAREEKKQKMGQRQQTAPQVEMWADVGDGGQYDQPYGIGGLRMGAEPSKNVGFIFTPSVYLDFPKSDFLRKVETRVYYGYRGSQTNIEDSVYFIGFLTTSKSYKFLKPTKITITADGEKLVLGKVRRYYRQGDSYVNELMFGMITRAQLMKIAKSEKITVQIGNNSGLISSDSLMYLNNLMNAT